MLFVFAESPHPLVTAAEKGDIPALTVLLEGGADIEQRNEQDDTALHTAAGKGHVEAVKLLLSRGADIHSRGQIGNTPLHWACLKGKSI